MEQFCSNFNDQVINSHLQAKAKKRLKFRRLYSPSLIPSEFQRDFFFFTSFASLLTLKLSPAAGISELFPLPLSICWERVHEGEAWRSWRWRAQLFNITNNPGLLPKYVCDGDSAPGARIMSEDISHCLHLAWSAERRPLSLQLPGAEMDKGRHTQRDFRHESRRIFMRFKSVYSLFCLLENGFIWKKKEKKKEGRSANGAKTGTGSGEVSTALACLAAVAGRMFHSEGLGWLL